MSVALQDLGSNMADYKRAVFQDEEAAEVAGDGSISPDSMEVGFRKSGGPLLSRLGSRIPLKLVRAAVSLFVVLLLLGLVISLGIQYSQDPSHTTCLTEACIIVASKVLEALDRETHPCDDFYQYACGGVDQTEPTARRPLQVEHLQQHLGSKPSHYEALAG
ncbi:hypothetical protein lerEdw1_008641 [Lerista edwardsae]|nr:hypothetical protein lerEdw1_008641 [Lerista edwardsae]